MDWKQLQPALISAFIGSFSGALLVSFIRKEQFMPFIICILLLVLVYTILKKNLGLHHQHKTLSNVSYFLFSIGTGGIIGFYDGLIGPGTGSFIIFAYIVLFGYDFLHANAYAKLVNCVTSFSALIFFFVKGAIVWHIALPVAASNMAGNYLGAHIAFKKGSGFIRVFFIVVVLALIAKLSYDYLPLYFH